MLYHVTIKLHFYLALSKIKFALQSTNHEPMRFPARLLLLLVWDADTFTATPALVLEAVATSGESVPLLRGQPSFMAYGTECLLITFPKLGRGRGEVHMRPMRNERGHEFR